MQKTSHIILGLSINTSEIVDRLQKQGEKEIYVIDYKQLSKVRERNGVVYLSPEGASIITKSTENITYHHYLSKRRRRDKN